MPHKTAFIFFFLFFFFSTTFIIQELILLKLTSLLEDWLYILGSRISIHVSLQQRSLLQQEESTAYL